MSAVHRLLLRKGALGRLLEMVGQYITGSGGSIGHVMDRSNFTQDREKGRAS